MEFISQELSLTKHQQFCSVIMDLILSWILRVLDFCFNKQPNLTMALIKARCQDEQALGWPTPPGTLCSLSSRPPYRSLWESFQVLLIPEATSQPLPPLSTAAAAAATTCPRCTWEMARHLHTHRSSPVRHSGRELSTSESWGQCLVPGPMVLVPIT